MAKAKVYNNFEDKFGNKHSFDTYEEFSKFWFGLPYQYAKASFPDFARLQRAAANSKEARTRTY